MPSRNSISENPDEAPVKVSQTPGLALREDDLRFIEDVSPQALAKVNWMIMPTLSILYLIGHIDRANIASFNTPPGNAKIEGLEDSLGMAGSDYNIALSIFFVPYILAEVPSNCILYKFKRPSRFLAFLVVAWGIVITCTGVVNNTLAVFWFAAFFLVSLKRDSFRVRCIISVSGRLSIHIPYSIQARMEYGIWNAPRMEAYSIRMEYKK
ncbi:hypothetical protein B0J13DRAFT_657547 [Dactylonectria estremocensis]|uniref:Major facilitator superfamily (MFS) profile domain-containing protein n=1 Tax=Dactylonectria estremocensis TaxID=1079267 RepID=A0A9P9D3S9_9HYPO|nr:hypothetical protein B0J13DRAFT_657547 [Dactylonectria estremocensis]